MCVCVYVCVNVTVYVCVNVTVYVCVCVCASQDNAHVPSSRKEVSGLPLAQNSWNKHIALLLHLLEEVCRTCMYMYMYVRLLCTTVHVLLLFDWSIVWV